MEKYIELAKKLKALADKGAAGERYNAQKKLDEIMARYGIIPEDIEEQVRELVWFKIKRGQKQLFAQVVFSIVSRERDILASRDKPYEFAVDVTKGERVEITAKFEFFWMAWSKYLNAWKKEKGKLYAAFIHKNRIFNESDPKKNWDEMSPEEQRKAMEIAMMSQAIERSVFNKQLEGSDHD